MLTNDQLRTISGVISTNAGEAIDRMLSGRMRPDSDYPCPNGHPDRVVCNCAALVVDLAEAGFVIAYDPAKAAALLSEVEAINNAIDAGLFRGVN